jgi:hypothetical protein
MFKLFNVQWHFYLLAWWAQRKLYNPILLPTMEAVATTAISFIALRLLVCMAAGVHWRLMQLDAFN